MYPLLTVIGLFALAANLFAGASVPWLLVIFLLFPGATFTLCMFCLMLAGASLVWVKEKLLG